MPRMEFVPTIPVFERAKTVHALDRAATGIRKYQYTEHKNFYEETTRIMILLLTIVANIFTAAALISQICRGPTSKSETL
jgi:hypothetical protein